MRCRAGRAWTNNANNKDSFDARGDADESCSSRAAAEGIQMMFERKSHVCAFRLAV